MSGNDKRVGTGAFRDSCCDGEEDTVAEWDDGGAHIGFIVIPGWDSIRSAEQRAGEMGREGMQVDRVQRNAESRGLETGAGELALGMVTAVIKRDGGDQFVLLVCPGESRGGVDSAGEQHDAFHSRKNGESRRTIFGAVFGRRGEANTAAGSKTTDYPHPAGLSGRDEIIQDAVDDLLVEGWIVTEGDEVILETFRLDNFVRRTVRNGE